MSLRNIKLNNAFLSFFYVKLWVYKLIQKVSITELQSHQQECMSVLPSPISFFENMIDINYWEHRTKNMWSLKTLDLN